MPVTKLQQTIAYGDDGPPTKLVQQWLNLHSIETRIDGIFGENTEDAVLIFQNKNSIEEDGVVADKTFELLVTPLTNVLNWKPDPGRSLKESIIELSILFQSNGARELGANEGPWVQLVMDGSEGRAWHWCMGWVTWVALRVATLLDKLPLNIMRTFSCTSQANHTMSHSRLLPFETLSENAEPGDIFLIRSKSESENKWIHTGFIKEMNVPVEGMFTTIEGNFSGRVGVRTLPSDEGITSNRIDWIQL